MSFPHSSALHRFNHGRVASVLCFLSLSILLSQTAWGQVDGRNVTVVRYPNGSFAQLNPGHWRESNNNGVNDFAETARDEWSVYMLDQSRDLSIQLDLFKKAVILNWDRTGSYKIYDITSSEGPPVITVSSDGPAGYSRCAGEGEAYTFSYPVDVAYGSNGTFFYKRGVTGTITFDNANFGDPVPGVLKSGYFQQSSGSYNPTVVATPTMLANEAAFLNANDEKLVLKWIMDEVTDAHVEYCWKRSHPRFTEGLTRCPPGKILENLLCYNACPPDYLPVGPICWHNCPPGYTNMGPTCLQNAESYSAPSRVADCPPGYTNMGLTCYQGPDTYSAPSIVASCPSGFTNMGASCYRAWPPKSLSMDAMTCPGGYFKSGGRCYQNCRPGYTNNGEFCGKGASSLGMSSMVCPSGYFQGADGRCHQNCNDGYTNTGELCTKGANVITNSSSDRGVGTPMVCREGLIHNGAGLCFEPCHPGYAASSDADPVCWQPCPDNQSVACGAGCANALGACVQETWEMVDAVSQMALNVVTLGESSAFTAAKGAVKTAVRAGDRVAAKMAAKLAAKELAKSFEQMTSRKVMNKLKENFKDQAMEWITEEYATLLLKTAKNDEFSTEDLWDLAALDPTGMAEVVHAFYKPVCAKNNPFPSVTLTR